MNEFLSDTEQIFASAANTDSTLQRLARAAVPSLSDFCLIFLVEGKELRCAASAHATAAGERLLRRLRRIYKITRNDPVSTVAHVVRTGRPKLRSDIRQEATTQRANVRVFTLHNRLGVRSVLAVPIGAPPAVLGAISFSYADSGRRYTAHDIPRARRLARLASAFLRERARVAASTPKAPPVTRRSIRLRARA
jgi:GAF domain-containing protein